MQARAGGRGAVNGRLEQKRQWLKAPAMTRTQQKVAQSGLGRAGSAGWCRRWRGRRSERPGLARGNEWCKQGLMSAVEVATDAGDGGTGG